HISASSRRSASPTEPTRSCSRSMRSASARATRSSVRRSRSSRPEAIARRNAVPVFADIDSATLNLDPADVERRLTKHTKAIVPVHLFGRPAAVAELRRFGLPLLEDAAQAFGSPDIATSVASTFSFFPTKNLFGLGDGGLVAVNDAE